MLIQFPGVTVMRRLGELELDGFINPWSDAMNGAERRAALASHLCQPAPRGIVIVEDVGDVMRWLVSGRPRGIICMPALPLIAGPGAHGHARLYPWAQALLDWHRDVHAESRGPHSTALMIRSAGFARSTRSIRQLRRINTATAPRGIAKCGGFCLN
jgi:hypothetical protein